MINISLAPETLFHLGGFPVTNSMLGMLVGAVTLIVLVRLVTKKMSDRPGRGQVMLEWATEALLDLMDSVTGSRDKTKKFFPIVATIFLFVLAMNWISLVPIFGTFGMNETREGVNMFIPFFRGGTADLNMTLALAFISVIATQYFGVTMGGAKQYASRFFNFKNPIFTFVGLLEFIGEFTKIISFSFRLFGNIFAGEVLLLVIASLVPMLASVPFYALELFVGLIQAFVFAVLTLVFFTIAAASHDEHAEEHA